MQTYTKNSTVTFRRAFTFEGFDEALPAGEYRVTSEEDILDGISLPDCLRTYAVLHLHPTPGRFGLARTLTVSWEELERALSYDSRFAAMPADPDFDEMMAEPIIRLRMQADNVSEDGLRGLISPKSKKDPSDAIAER
jgi:hypothetical protein